MSFVPFGGPELREVLVPPRPNFRGISGRIRDTSFNTCAFYEEETRGNTAARELGLRFERKVLDEIGADFPIFWRQPKVRFFDDSGMRLCIPDAVAREGDDIIVIEVKIQHMPEAWWQLERLYRPVLETHFKPRRLRALEIVQSFDPAMPFPISVEVFETIASFKDSDVPFGVVVWKK